MDRIGRRPEALTQTRFHYCPGCGHGLVHRIIAEVIDELGIREQSIGVTGVGCSGLAWRYFNCDMLYAPHGRAPAAATGVKRSKSGNVVFTYQGDGDGGNIGIAELLHAAQRGEKITVFLINNTVFAMTGGQMASTSLVGQVTTTSPKGRTPEHAGFPLHLAELLGSIEGCAYAARVAVNSVKNLNRAKKAVRKAFEAQRQESGFSFVEFLAPCPVSWHMTPVEAMERIDNEVMKTYPLFESNREVGAEAL